MLPRPTMYRGISMRSRLEADFARWLDSYAGYTWRYEPQCFANDTGQYLPDFLITGCSEPESPFKFTIGAYIEVKPTGLFDGADRVKTLYTVLDRMAIIWDSEPDASLCLVIWEYGGQQPCGQWICDPCLWWSSPSPDGRSSYWPTMYSNRAKPRFERVAALRARLEATT